MLFVWLAVLLLGATYAGRQIMGLFDGTFLLIGRGDMPFPVAVRELGRASFFVLLGITALALIPAAVTGVIARVPAVGRRVHWREA